MTSFDDFKKITNLNTKCALKVYGKNQWFFFVKRKFLSCVNS